MIRKPSALFIALCAGLLIFVLGVLAGGRFAAHGAAGVQSDTLVIYRKITDSAAVLASTKAAGYDIIRCGSLDSLKRAADKPVRTVTKIEQERVEVTVTKDSIVYVQVPISEQEWRGQKDSVHYTVRTSGYHVSLEGVSFAYPERAITNTIDRTRKLGFAVTAGPSCLVTPSGKVMGGVGVTAGLAWRF